MDKKGAEGFSFSTMLAIIFGVVGLVIVVIGFTQGWEYFGTLLGFASDDLPNAAKACAVYLGAEDASLTTLNYCKYRELTINGQKQWVNCDFIYTEAEAKSKDSAGFVKLADGICLENYCTETLQKKTEYDGKEWVNGVSCPKP